MSVLEQIRAVLPEGCRLHVRFTRGGHPAYASSAETAARPRTPQLPDLTMRQRDILGLLVEGLSNKEIGRKLSLSHFTIRNHISQIMRLLDVSSRKGIIAKLAELDFGANHGATPSNDGFTGK